MGVKFLAPAKAKDTTLIKVICNLAESIEENIVTVDIKSQIDISNELKLDKTNGRTKITLPNVAKYLPY